LPGGPPWFLFALGSAVFAATSDALCKKALSRHGTFVVAWVRFACASPFLLLFFFTMNPVGPDRTFWLILLMLLPLEITAVLLYMGALRRSPLSLTVPFLSLTPVFTLFFSYVILGELPDRSGGAGVLLIVLGAYLLNVHLSRQGILDPIRAIGKEQGSLMMIGVAFLYSITSNLGKLAVVHSSPGFMATLYLPILSVALLPVARRGGLSLAGLRAGGWLFLCIGASQALMSIAHFQALSMTQVSYMISLKRTSLILSVLYGAIFFSERHLRQRLLGSALMVLGVALILL